MRPSGDGNVVLGLPTSCSRTQEAFCTRLPIYVLKVMSHLSLTKCPKTGGHVGPFRKIILSLFMLLTINLVVGAKHLLKLYQY